MLEILDIDETPLIEIPCVSAAPGGRRFEERTLPVLCGRVAGLPEPLDALVVTSDLQAYDTYQAPTPQRRLIGHVLAERLGAMAEDGQLPDPMRTGVLLAGDLYAIPTLTERGGLGDVDGVWQSFLERFRWVAGVAGNHDSFCGRTDFKSFPPQPHRRPLDADIVDLDGLNVAGVSGVIGRSLKPWRIKPKFWRNLVESMLALRPDVLVLHQGPGLPEQHLPGHALIHEVLTQAHRPPLTIFGHCHWETPMVSHRGAQWLNVDYRAVILERP